MSLYYRFLLLNIFAITPDVIVVHQHISIRFVHANNFKLHIFAIRNDFASSSLLNRKAGSPIWRRRLQTWLEFDIRYPVIISIGQWFSFCSWSGHVSLEEQNVDLVRWYVFTIPRTTGWWYTLGTAIMKLASWLVTFYWFVQEQCTISQGVNNIFLNNSSGYLEIPRAKLWEWLVNIINVSKFRG